MNPLPDISSTFEDPQMLHAALVHLPIGLALVGVPLLLWNLWRARQSQLLDATLVLVYATAAGFAYWAVQAGEQAAAELPNILPEEIWGQVNLHSGIGERVWIFAAATALTLVLALLTRRGRVRSASRTIALLMGTATMLWTLRAGHEGGKLVYIYGVGTPALEIQTHRAKDAAAALSRANSVVADAGAYRAHSLSTPLNFASDIQPLLSAYCVSCHNPSEAESDLDLTTLAGLLEGGKKAGPALLTDSPEASPLLLYLRGHLQPQMPKNEPPLSVDQIAMLERWIRDYASEEPGSPRHLASSVRNTPEETASGAELRDAWSPRGFKYTSWFDASLSKTTLLRTQFRYEHLSSVDAVSAREIEQGTPDLHFALDRQEHLNRYKRYRRLALVEPPPEVPSADPGLKNPIDRFIYDAMRKADIAAPEQASDRALIRRAYLDLIGVYPGFEEVDRFENDASQEKYDRLVNSLLEMRSDYADHWVPQWEDALASNYDFVFPEDRERSRSDFRSWLAKSFRENRPLDEIVLDLFITNAPEFSGQYVLSRNRNDSLLTASDIAQVFLGEPMRCASCHNHFENQELTLTRTLGFASFFSKDDLELIRCEQPSGQLVTPTPPFPLPAFEETASRSLKDRKEIAGLWLVDPTNDRFAQVTVNRIWKRYFGVGLYEPADEWRSDIEASHPELLRWLADEFRASGFDVQRMVKLILTSRTYRHTFDSDRAATYDPDAPGAGRYFESSALRRLTAEQYWDSVRKVLGFEWQNEHRTYRIDAPLLRVIATAMGRPIHRNEAQTERRDDASIEQALLMMNDETFNDLIVESPAIAAIIDTFEKDGDLTEALGSLYQLILSRDPTDDEQKFARRYFEGINASADRLEDSLPQRLFLQDTCWVLLTSPEYLFIP